MGSLTRQRALQALDSAFEDKLSLLLQIMVASLTAGDSMRVVGQRFSVGLHALLDAHNAAADVIRTAIPDDKTESAP